MARRLNAAGVSYARSLIASGKVSDGAWSFSSDDGNALLGSDGDWSAYGKVHLAENTDAAENTKERFSYPFAKGGTLYRRGLIAAKGRATAEGDTAIATAAGDLLASLKGKGTTKMADSRFASAFEFKFTEESQPGAFEGYGSVFNNMDSHGDIILPGAFAKTIAAYKAAGRMPGMFAEHSFAFLGGDPLPIGIWDDLSEDDHGLHVKGRLVALDSDTGKRMRGLMEAKAMQGLSIAFPTPVGDDNVKFGSKPGEPRRWLKHLEVHSIDVVRDPSNEAAMVMSMKSVLAHADHAGAVAAVKAAIALHRSTTAGGDSMTADERAQMHEHLQNAHKCLTGTAMKFADRPETIRDFEQFLRDEGKFSNRMARLIAEGGFKAALGHRDDGAAAVTEAARTISGALASLKGLSLAS